MQSFASVSADFEAFLQRALIFPAEPHALYAPCRDLLKAGGKRVRPALSLMAAQLFGDIPEHTWHVALAVELFHNFTLAHDDMMDRAPLRRGQPTIYKQHGDAAAVLCGDVLCIMAYQSLSKAGNSLPQLLQVFNTTAIEVCEGQQLDLEFEGREVVTHAEYIRMIRLKTSVLLAASLHMGAVSNGASASAAAKLYDFGINMGLAFQLQDDYLDAFGKPEQTGKQTGGDILANKKTIVSITAWNNADDATRQELKRISAGSPDQIAETLCIYRQLGTEEQCRAEIQHYTMEAFAHLERLGVSNSRKSALADLADQLLHRQS